MPNLKKRPEKKISIKDPMEVIDALIGSGQIGSLAKNLSRQEVNEIFKALAGTKQAKAKGGNISNQMEMFEEGGLKDEGGTVDPISGNDVPSGSTQEEVRDDIPAQLSEGEFVFPADVVRYLGLEKLMELRQEAKQGLKTMEDMGQMGNSEEATMRDDMPFDINDIDMEDEEEYNSEAMEMAQGGVVYAATGFGGTVTSAGPNITTKASNFGNTATRTPQPKTYTPPPIPTAAPTGGFKYGATKGASESKLNFDNLFKDTGAADEYKTYVNDAGAEIQVPFKNGKLMTGFTIPEGYKLKTEKVDTAKIQSTGIKSTRPTQQDDGGDGGDDGSKGGASISFGGTPDPNKPGLQKGAITANISYNVNALGGITGIFGGMGKVADINKGLDVETKGNQYGKTTNPVELQFGNGKSIAVTSKVYSTIKSDVYGKTSKEMKDRMEVLNNIATQKDISFDEKTNLYTDSGGRTISQEQAEQAGIDINNHIDSEISKGRSMESIVNSLNNTEVSMAQDVSIEAEDDQQSYSTTTAPSLTTSPALSASTPSNYFSNNDDEDSDPGGGYSDSDSDTGGDTNDCVIATHGVSTGGFTPMEKAKAELWCQRTYHDKWYGEAFRRGYKAWGMKHVNGGTAPQVYQEFKDFVSCGRGIKKGFKLKLHYYFRTLHLFTTGLFIKR